LSTFHARSQSSTHKTIQREGSEIFSRWQLTVRAACLCARTTSDTRLKIERLQSSGDRRNWSKQKSTKGVTLPAHKTRTSALKRVDKSSGHGPTVKMTSSGNHVSLKNGGGKTKSHEREN
jgi:hypothetical protein